ncbi:YwhD family protein [Niallia circulans]|uniref:YwhD family protein n=1 Tax=Niallia circulans TaxID=1397 RepID=UPI00155F6578|nr:YwhD family protein [Niallia circulans]NRG32890.1 YwhD family protein [Niallia circulans]
MDNKKEGSPKKNAQFNILRNDPTKGDGGYGVGSISLENVTPIIIDRESQEVFIDIGAMHGRSKVEQKVFFKNVTKEEVLDLDPHKYWVIWIALDRNEEGAYYSGAGACEILVAKKMKEGSRKRFGYKAMPEHVNSLDKAIKRRFALDNMDYDSKQSLKKFLVDFNNDYWERSPEELKNSLNNAE